MFNMTDSTLYFVWNSDQYKIKDIVIGFYRDAVDAIERCRGECEKSYLHDCNVIDKFSMIEYGDCGGCHLHCSTVVVPNNASEIFVVKYSEFAPGQHHNSASLYVYFAQEEVDKLLRDIFDCEHDGSCEGNFCGDSFTGDADQCFDTVRKQLVETGSSYFVGTYEYSVEMHRRPLNNVNST